MSDRQSTYPARTVEVLTRVQGEIREWSSRNFPNNTPYEPLQGMGEELGEMKHAFLKMRQGIRGSAEEHLAALRDGFGDFLIFFLDYSWRDDWEVADVVVPDWRRYGSREEHRRWGSLARHIGLLEVWYEERFEIEASGEASDVVRSEYHAGGRYLIQRVLVDLFDAAYGFDLDLLEILEETWADVKKRNWVVNKATGEVDAAS